MKKILFIVIIFSTISNSQNFQLGFDFEIHQIRIKNQNNSAILGGNGFPGAFHLLVNYIPLHDITLSTKIGKTFHTEFLGLEFGLNCKYEFFEPLYFSIGFLAHSNEGGTLDNEVDLSYATIFMSQTGIGIKASKLFSAGLDYYFPFSQKVIGRELIMPGYTSPYFEPYKFKSMIRLSLIFGWDI